MDDDFDDSVMMTPDNKQHKQRQTIVDSWTTSSVRRDSPPHSQKSAYNLQSALVIAVPLNLHMYIWEFKQLRAMGVLPW